jgi:hypothetical protein
MKPARRAVSRDTRVLLMIVVISTAILWMLARLRFPDREATPNPVPPVLAQLAPPSAFEDMTAAVAQVEQRVGPSIVMLGFEFNASRTAGAARRTQTALRFRDDLAVTVFDDGDAGAPGVKIAGAIEIARDRASGLAVVRLPDRDPVPAVRTARALSYPRVLIAADPHAGGVSLRPVFIGALYQIDAPTPVWPEPLWALPDGIPVTGGTFVFSADGAWVGLVIGRGGAMRLVPAGSVIAMAEWLVKEGQTQPGWLGIDVEPLSDTVAAAAGASAGITVTWVDPRSPAAGQVRSGDVIERVEETPVATLEDWTALVSRLDEGEAVAIGARRAGELVEAHLIAGSPPGPVTRPLGLTLRTIRRTGAEVVRVDPGSAAAAAGLQSGDVITLVGDVEQPTAPQVTRTLAATSRERPVIIAITRGSSHHVVVLERTW